MIPLTKLQMAGVTTILGYIIDLIDIVELTTKFETKTEITPSNTRNLHMINIERSLLRKILTELMNELKQSETFETLTQFNLNRQKTRDDEQNLMENYNKLQNECRELSLLIITENQEAEMEIKYLADKLAKTMDKIMSLRTEYDLKRKFVKDWYKSGEIQNRFQIHFDMKKTNDEHELLETKIDDEKLINQRIVKYFQLEIQKLEERIEKMKEQYKVDTKKKDEDIIHLKIIRAAQLEKIKLISEQLSVKTNAMEEWIKEKNSIKAKEERRQKESSAALKLQSWWRGIMVRHYLGMFSKLKAAKKLGDKNKKKGRKS